MSPANGFSMGDDAAHIGQLVHQAALDPVQDLMDGVDPHMRRKPAVIVNE